MKDKGSIALEIPLDGNYLQATWEDYYRCVVPADAGIDQIVATNHAFIAGAGVMLAGFKRCGDELKTAEEFEDFLDSIVQYLEQYTKEVQENATHDKSTD